MRINNLTIEEMQEIVDKAKTATQTQWPVKELEILYEELPVWIDELRHFRLQWHRANNPNLFKKEPE